MIYINGHHIRAFPKDQIIFLALRDLGKAFGFSKVADIYREIPDSDKSKVRIINVNGGDAYTNVVSTEGFLRYLTTYKPDLVETFQKALDASNIFNEPIIEPLQDTTMKPTTKLLGLYHVVTFDGSDIRCKVEASRIMVSIQDICESMGVTYQSQLTKLERSSWSKKNFSWEPEYLGGPNKVAFVDLKLVQRWLSGIHVGRVSKPNQGLLIRHVQALVPFLKEVLEQVQETLQDSSAVYSSFLVPTPEPSTTKVDLVPEQTTLPVASDFVTSTDVNILGFDFDGHPVRVSMKNSEPWFVLNDVCEALSIANPQMVGQRLKREEKDGISLTDPIGRPQNTTVINESGLYRVIFKSKKARAEKFQDWVLREVLPSIRKTGSYSVVPAANTAVTAPNTLEEILTETERSVTFANPITLLAKGVGMLKNYVVSEIASVRADMKSEIAREIEAVLNRERNSRQEAPKQLPVPFPNIVTRVLETNPEVAVLEAVELKYGLEGKSSKELKEEFQSSSEVHIFNYGRKQGWSLKKMGVEHARFYLKAIQAQKNHVSKWNAVDYIRAMSLLEKTFPLDALEAHV